MEPGAGRMSVAFSLAWLRPLLELLQTCVSLHRKARGALCLHQGGAGERPPFSTLRARPNEHPSFRCARVSSWLRLTMSGHRAGFHRQLATAGPLPFKAKEFVPMLSERGTIHVLGRALRAPEVMLDDAVQAHPGRLRLRRS